MEIIFNFVINQNIYDSLNNYSHVLKVKIEDKILKINFKKIIDTQFSLGNIENNETEKLKDFLHLGKFSKAPCGGFINFYEIKNKNCRYVIYSGVNEVSNSHYLVTLHKIIKI